MAFDFFAVPTVTFRVLYCFFVIEHARRRILHYNLTPHPSAAWVVQQLREAFPQTAPYRYAIFDRDSTFNAEIIALLTATGLEPKRTSIRAPWQNGTTERWIGSCRRDLNADHLRRSAQRRTLWSISRRAASASPSQASSRAHARRSK